MITELLVKYIINKYTQDMGNYFDEYQGQEETCFENVYDTFVNASLIDKIKLLRGVY